MATHRTKKIKQQGKDIKSMWAKFDEEIGDKKMECVYNQARSSEECTSCTSPLSITSEGFLGCTNVKCGIIYTDMIEQSAEWRFYGADDTGNSDPTRCGMPINPLLAQSSFDVKSYLVAAAVGKCER